MNALVLKSGVVALLAVVALNCADSASPPIPAHLERLANDTTSAVAGTAISISVRVTDRTGSPVADATVSWEIAAGSGYLERPSSRSDDSGLASVEWTLGTVAGNNILRATSAGVEPVIFTVEGLPGAPVTMQIHEGDQQSAIPGSEVAVRPAVRLLDTHGNGVPERRVTFWAPQESGSTIIGINQNTDADGVARVGSWAPSALGPNTLTAFSSNLPPVRFTAWVEDTDGSFNMWIEGIHLNQGSQRADGSIGGIAGRPGMLRVLVRANEANTYSPTVRVRLSRNGVVFREQLLEAPRAAVPTEPDLNEADQTWNLVLTAAEVVTGLEVEAFLDPDEAVRETDRSDNRFPRQTRSLSLEIDEMKPLHIVFIPIRTAATGVVGRIASHNMDEFLAATRQWIPGSAVTAVVRPALTTNQDLTTYDGWASLLGEIQAIRTAEGAVGEYYHGIVGDQAGMLYGGIAYRPGSPGYPTRSAISYDNPLFASATVAHELAHNMGRGHSPCGVTRGTVDESYPHADAAVGSAGFDIAGNGIFDSSHKDYLSYCSPRWTSDYTWQAILEWRRADPLARSDLAAPSPAKPASAERTRGLLVWGRFSADGVTLNPAFELDSRPVLPQSDGPYRIIGTSADGATLFSLSFDGVAIEDGADSADRHFAWFIPLDAATLASLAEIRLHGLAGTAMQRGLPTDAATAGPPVAPASIEASGTGQLKVRWDTRRNRMAMVREAATGRVLGFDRSGALLLPDRFSAAGIEVHVSDGISTRVIHLAR